MKLDTTLAVQELNAVAEYAKIAEDIGFDTLWSTESKHDPFLPLAVAATTTETLQLGTAIALAFPRRPTITAHTSWDIQTSSHGRFTLGLGTQVKGHNERRFSVPFDPVGPRPGRLRRSGPPGRRPADDVVRRAAPALILRHSR